MKVKSKEVLRYLFTRDWGESKSFKQIVAADALFLVIASLALTLLHFAIHWPAHNKLTDTYAVLFITFLGSFIRVAITKAKLKKKKP